MEKSIGKGVYGIYIFYLRTFSYYLYLAFRNSCRTIIDETRNGIKHYIKTIFHPRRHTKVDTLLSVIMCNGVVLIIVSSEYIYTHIL